MNNWEENNMCMAHLNNKNKNKRCIRGKAEESDFCRYHKKSSKYATFVLNCLRKKDYLLFKIDKNELNHSVNTYLKRKKIHDVVNKLHQLNKKRVEYLDDNHGYTLMGMYESFESVPFAHQIKIDNEYWDIKILTHIFTQQINDSAMEYPYPIYPSNPFTRKRIEPNNLLNMRYRLENLGHPLNKAFSLFINSDKGRLIDCYNQSIKEYSGFSSKIIRILEKKMRFRICNYKNSQGCYTGYWVRKNEPLTVFEKKYDKWKNTPYQTISYIAHEIIENPMKEYLSEQLDKMPEEDIVI